MKNMESLTKMPFSKITHLLETMNNNGISENIINRYRLDSDFTKKISDLIIKENLDHPGQTFFVPVDYSKNRFEIQEILIKSGMWGLKNEILQKITPKTIIRNKTENIEMFLVQLYKDTNEEKAQKILHELNLVSVNVEEALWFAMNGLPDRNSAIVIDSKYKNGKKIEYLSIGRTIEGRQQISLYYFDWFDSKNYFLVKRKH
jgi:hypothetical protein